MRLILALALLVLVSPAAAQTDAERAEALRSAAEALRSAVETLESAAETLEGTAAAEPEAEAAAQAPQIEEEGAVRFLDPLDNTPLDIPAEDVTAAVEHFHATAENPYDGDEAAIAEGKKLYDRLCAACHLKDGTGRIGPSLVDENWKYPRTNTDKGQFEIIYAGGAGAMQPFHQRISQDEILRLMAYLDVLGQQ